MNRLKDIATALVITFGVLLMVFTLLFAVNYFNLFQTKSEFNAGSVASNVCPFAVEQPTTTPTAVLCECVCEIETTVVPTLMSTATPVVPVSTATPQASPPPATRTPEPTSPPNATSTPSSTTPPNPTVTPDPTSPPEPTSTVVPTNPPEPTATEKEHCNKGSGNGGEGCDPGNNPCNGNDDEDDDDDDCDDDDDHEDD